MKQTLTFFAMLNVVLLVFDFNSSAQTTYTFTCPTTTTTWTVPAGVTSINVDMSGAAGGTAGPGLGAPLAGYGGRTQATLTVVPGTVLQINVGGVGGNGNATTGATGGYNGGGKTAVHLATYAGGGGGGASDIRFPPYAIANREIVAAGGGGSGSNGACTTTGQPGGNGGGLTGAGVTTCTGTLTSGLYGYAVTLSGGGTQTAGGIGGWLNGIAATYGQGGTGTQGNGGNAPGVAGNDPGIGGGGGGGYWGGGGGCWIGGGGGSSYTDPALTTGVILTTGYNDGCGKVTITVECNAGTITGPAFSLCQGSTITLTDAAGGGTWSSSNTAVGTISATGVVYGVGTGGSVGAGTTTITYTAVGGCSATAVVTVYALPDAITGTPLVCEGSATTLANAITGGAWATVAGSGSVSVTGGGVVTGLTTPPLTQGTATVSYSFGGGACAASVVVTINPVSPISSVTPFMVCSGLTTTVSDAIAGTWSSSNTAVATIGSSSGFITGLAAGTSTIVDLYPSGCSASAVLTVNVSPVAITGPPMLCYNSSGTFLDGTPGGTWSSSSPGIADIVAGTGIATAVSNAAGTTTISYTMPVTGCGAGTILSVNPIPATITGSLNVCTGLTTSLSDVTAGGTWSSNNTTGGPVGASGIVTGITGGTAVISYTLPTTCYATATVTINPSPAAIAGNFSMCIGIPSLLSDPTGGSGAWSSANTGVATIGAGTGIVSPLSSGTTVISYIYTTGCNAATIITVTPSPAAITGTLSSCANLFTPLSDASGGGTWSSSNTTVGTIGLTTGLVYAIATGVTEVEYTYTTTGCYASAVFTVNPSPVPISGTPDVCDGQTSTFNDATAGGTWSSTNVTIVTVGASSGTVQGQNPGTATIIYSMGTSCFTTYPVTVNPAPTAISGPPSVCQGYAVALTNGTTPGTWTVTSGSGSATITPAGVLTGMNPGVVTVSYSTPACNAVNYIMTVNPLPAPITGVSNLCLGSGTSLTDATTGGTWSSSNAGASVSSTGVVSGVDTGAGTNISYTLPTGCYVVAPVVVFPIPDSIAGVDSVCPGSSIVLSDPTPGGVWSSSNGTIAKSVAITGEVDGMAGGTVNISYTLISGCYVTVPFIVENPLPASLTVTQSLDTIKCNGVPDTLTAHPVNGGEPTFEWENWGAYIDTGRVYRFVPEHGDYITCVMTTHDICSSPASVQTSVVMNVYPDVAPTVVISTSSSDTSSYLGQVYTFFTSVTYGGTDPGYQWYVNSVAVPGATSSTFTTHVYDYNDSVYCAVTGNSPCDTGIIGNSDTIVIDGIDNLSVGALSATGNDLGLFPNPNAGSFTLSGTVSGTTNKDVQLEITDMLGRTIYTGTTTPQNGTVRAEIKLDNNVAAGTYLLRVNTETATQTFHFVIGK